MQISKTFYLWTVVLVVNIAFIGERVIEFFNTKRYSPFGIENFDPMQQFFTQLIITACLSILLSVVPVRISQSESKLKHWFGFGIPVTFFTLAVFFFSAAQACTGKFCGLAEIIIAFLLVSAGTPILFFYSLGLLTKKYSEKFIQSVLVISVIITTTLFISWIFYPSFW